METVKKTLIGLRDAFLLSLFTTTIVVIIVNMCFNDKPVEQENALIQTYYYEVPEGKNGITCYRVYSNNEVDIEYKLNGVYYMANNLDSMEYSNEMKKLYQ